MPVPHVSEALSRFTVLDLTRVRSGDPRPLRTTCVRQLADWGGNVVKIDALTENAGGEQLGGPRQGFTAAMLLTESEVCSFFCCVCC